MHRYIGGVLSRAALMGVCVKRRGFSFTKTRYSPALESSKCLCLHGVERMRVREERNLVDPASSHMLVSKIKPCMSQYKFIHGETAKGSLKQL